MGRRLSKLVSPETGLHNHVEIPRGDGCALAFNGNLIPFYSRYFLLNQTCGVACPKGNTMKKTISSLLCLLVSYTSSALSAEIDIQTEEVVVTANRFERKDTETTYASEIHTAERIGRSGARSLYDYLLQHSSVNVLPGAGNRAAPLLDLRGFGAESGFQSIVITVDGQRMNNIDLSSQLIGAIPLGNIDRIEITKGSGSVLHGDGAVAGTIQIHTKAKSGVTVSASAGNFQTLSGYVSAGVSEQYFDLSASAAHDSNKGYGKKDVTGNRDDFISRSQNIKLKLKPSNDLYVNLEGTSSRIDTRYTNTLSMAQFKDDPRLVGTDFLGRPVLNHQAIDSDQWRIGVGYSINSNWKIAVNHYREDKLSDYITFNNQFDYDYRSNDLAFSYEDASLSVVGGVQNFEGSREGATDITSKDSLAAYVSGEYRLNAWTFSAGTRREKIEYDYTATGGNSLDDSEELDAWDIGANYRLTQTTSIFSNYNKAYQAPDVDRFFLFGGGFNGFIAPARSRTFNLGLNHVTPTNRLKLTGYHVDLSDEIYYNPFTFANTNLDETHKYGIEIQDTWKITEKLSSSIIYNYIRAKIDREADGTETFDGKELPGVPKHSVNTHINFRPTPPININLSHTWRSKGYVIGDFANALGEKQDDYHSTNLALSYQWRNVQWFAVVSNLFEHKNGLFIRSDFPVANDVVAYPYDFERTWRIGMKVDL